MIKIILMCPTIACLYDVKILNFREYLSEDTTPLHLHDAYTWCASHHNFVEFSRDALHTDNIEAVEIATEGLESLIVDTEIQRCGKIL